MKDRIYTKRYCKGTSLKASNPFLFSRKAHHERSIYILLRQVDKKLKILFDHEIEKFNNIDNYKLIGEKACTKREFELMRITLKEFRENYLANNNSYNYSLRLIDKLNILGYSTTLAKKINKKKAF